MALGPIGYGLALVLMIAMLAGTILVDREHRLVKPTQLLLQRLTGGEWGRRSVVLLLRLLTTTGLAGLILFLLPPAGGMPPDWQIALAFIAWIAWCYRFGLLSRRGVAMATVEALPSLCLSLGWAQLLVLTRVF